MADNEKHPVPQPIQMNLNIDGKRLAEAVTDAIADLDRIRLLVNRLPPTK